MQRTNKGSRHVGLVECSSVGDRLVPLTGLEEFGRATPDDVLSAAALRPEESVAVSDVRLCPVVPSPDKIICIGLNYHAHVGETGRGLPTYPVMFTKFASSLVGPNDDILLPRESMEVDYEAELAVIIGRRGVAFLARMHSTTYWDTQSQTISRCATTRENPSMAAGQGVGPVDSTGPLPGPSRRG